MTDNCFHCGLSNPLGEQFRLTIFEQSRYFCCAGCYAIAETIVKNNLLDFYRFRQGPSNRPEEIVPQELVKLDALDSPEVLQEISYAFENTYEIQLGIEGITCAACGWLIEKQLNKLNFIESISVNVTTQRALVKWNKAGDLSEIIKQLKSLGYHGFPFNENENEKAFKKANRDYIKRILIAALGMMQVMTYAIAVYIGEFQDLEEKYQRFFHWLSGLIATPVVFYSAAPFFKSAFNNLKHGHFGMNLPVSIAILCGYLASCFSLLSNQNAYYFDSIVMFTFFLLIGRFLEHRARYQSLIKQQNFNQLLPLTASRKNSDGSVTEVSLKQINLGDILIIYSGGVIPVDGILLQHEADINEAILSGEFLPVTKHTGDRLLSGTTNHSASLQMKVTNRLAQSHLQSLINLQSKAEQLKPQSISLSDRVAHWYVLILLTMVLATACYWWLVEPDKTFSIVLSVLVVSCPCALSLATPAVVTAATTRLSDLGLMLRSADALQDLNQVNKVYFDKTGTLTTGKMTLTGITVLPFDKGLTTNNQQMNQDTCLQIAFLLERASSHPIAQAFNFEPQAITMKATDLKETPGMGVSGIIEGKHYLLGNVKLMQNIELQFEPTESINATDVFLACESQHIATFRLQDSLKGSAKQAVSKLKQQNYTVGLLTGDSQSAANQVAKQLGIDDVNFELSPEQKLSFIHQQQLDGHQCLMVGDGFNDVGALASAKMSITLGSGTELSKNSSAAVLVSNDLNTIASALSIAKKVSNVIKQNLAWAVGYNLFALPFAMMGLIPAWLAAIGMSLSSLVVVLNALRLKS
jgi:P-type Cu2+ transporter